MFWTIKKRTIIIALLCVFLTGIFCFTFFTTKQVDISLKKYTVIIDPGHGGIDGGCVGKTTGVFESDLNLKYAENLAKQLNNMNISCMLTRTTSGGLYDSSAKNLKKSDMKKRKQIIESYNPDIVISIHMNSYTLSSSRGAQAFYKTGSKDGKILADNVQSQLCSMIDYTKSGGKVGDYYIVNCTDIPSVLIECGFLSNEVEEKLLVSTDYQDKICYAITCGIVRYLNDKKLMDLA